MGQNLRLSAPFTIMLMLRCGAGVMVPAGKHVLYASGSAQQRTASLRNHVWYAAWDRTLFAIRTSKVKSVLNSYANYTMSLALRIATARTFGCALRHDALAPSMAPLVERIVMGHPHNTIQRPAFASAAPLTAGSYDAML